MKTCTKVLNLCTVYSIPNVQKLGLYRFHIKEGLTSLEKNGLRMSNAFDSAWYSSSNIVKNSFAWFGERGHDVKYLTRRTFTSRTYSLEIKKKATAKITFSIVTSLSKYENLITNSHNYIGIIFIFFSCNSLTKHFCSTYETTAQIAVRELTYLAWISSFSNNWAGSLFSNLNKRGTHCNNQAS